MLKWLNKLIDSNEREINRFRPIAAEVTALEPEMQARSDEELRAFVSSLKDDLAAGKKDLDDVLPEAFAAVREAAVRTIGQRHYDVQLMGGMVLHEGKIAEMRTGEGKTLVATLPTTLNALTGDGVHVVTVNDYLAKRDTQWMGPIYHTLGLSVACIQHEIAFQYDPTYTVEDPRYTHLRPLSHRREAYLADITYGTNNEFGFDYLRDNMQLDLSMCVQRPLNYAIVDEVDNILIDEARTPLIISGAAAESAQDYHSLAQLVPRLRIEDDYTVDEKTRAVTLTEAGIAKLEDLLQVSNLYDPEHYRMLHFVETAVKALVLYKRDRDYIVTDGQVVIVDEFTGRQMPGRRWSDGLHQAVEAKEGLQVQRENLTLATITFQNYFRLYNKLAGMTGTALTEAEEFHKIYKLDVVVVPTHRPMVRRDSTDLVYKSEEGKFEAVIDEIKDMYEIKRPVLVGTVTIEKSERISNLLQRDGIPHEVLNAKFHEREAAIIAQAGRPGSVTIATNMAGRGTDILLGGNAEGLALDEALQRGIDPEERVEEYQEILRPLKAQCDQDREAVVEVGGLHIIGTERHEARRIDHQLRGRAGRQGDPGSSRFYVSLEDEIMRRFGGDRIKQLMEWAGLEDDVPIENNLVTKSLENAQVKVEAYNFDIRKHLVEYDDVMNTQRMVIYGERRKILEGADLRTNITAMLRQEIEELVEVHLQARESEDWDVEGLFTELGIVLPPIEGFTMDEARGMTRDEIKDLLLDHAETVYEAREQELGPESMRVLERLVMLTTIETLWVEHLTAMEEMRQGIGLRAYAQTDPLVAYKQEGFKMFSELRDNIRHNVARGIFRANLVRQQAPPPLVQNVQTNREEVPEPVAAGARPASAPRPSATASTPNGNRKVGRNDPCWCNSGKKYKRCHGA